MSYVYILYSRPLQTLVSLCYQKFQINNWGAYDILVKYLDLVIYKHYHKLEAPN